MDLVILPPLTVAKESRARKRRNYAIYELLFSFHNPETFFNLPSFLINTYNRCHIIFQVCAYGIEIVITFLYKFL